jgi:heptosyltransferase-1
MGATGAVCCDTGLCHLAGMLDIPSVSFYGPTSDKLIGAVGKNQEHIIAKSSEFPCAPCYGRRCTINGKNEEMSDCMDSFKPMQVWNQLTALIAAR